MTSDRQIEANRRNALRSTGPRTEDGKLQSRRNAVRHGLTAETVIGSLEDAEDYRAFESAITADYDAQSAVERELVPRLASILWRLRRATTMKPDCSRFKLSNCMTIGKTARCFRIPVITQCSGGRNPPLAMQLHFVLLTT